MPVEALPEELKRLDIKDYFIPASLKRAGIIHALSGQVVVIHRSTREAYFGREGDIIYENDSLNTLANSRCRIKFLTEDVTTMASETNLGVESFSDQRKEGRKDAFFSMLKGKAMFYALRLFKYKQTRFSLKTPTAVMGVRGTKFGAFVYWPEKDKRAEGLTRIADRSNNMGMYLAQVDPGGNGKSFTDCFSADGYVEVNGRMVGPGNMYRGRDGAVIPTPPEYARAFESETEVQREGGKAEGGGEEKGDETAEAVSTGGGTGPGEFIDIVEKISDNTQQETGSETESTEGDAEIAKGKVAGRVSAIATIITDTILGKAYNQLPPSPKGPIYVSPDENPLSGGAESHVAHVRRFENDDQYKMIVQEQSATNMDAQVTQFGWGPGTAAALGTPHTFTWNYGGRYMDDTGREYLSWGWWEHTGGRIGEGGGDNFFAATGKIWEVEGLRTHTDYISYLTRQNAEYKYSGEAKGVFADSNNAGTLNPVELSGPFSCKIDFGGKKVSDFGIEATGGIGGGISVKIKNGSGVLENDGDFDISGFTGTINGNAINDQETGASGAVVGYTADGVGGQWFADDGNNYWATGEFHGKR